MPGDTLTHIQPVIDGELRLSLVHGRLHLQYRARGHRVPVTVPLSLDAADSLFARGAEIVRHGRAQPKDPF